MCFSEQTHTHKNKERQELKIWHQFKSHRFLFDDLHNKRLPTFSQYDKLMSEWPFCAHSCCFTSWSMSLSTNLNGTMSSLRASYIVHYIDLIFTKGQREREREEKEERNLGSHGGHFSADPFAIK